MCACVLCACVCVTDRRPRNVNQFPVSGPIRCTFAFHPSTLLHLYPPDTCLVVVYAVGASLSHSVNQSVSQSQTTIIPLILQTSLPTYPAFVSSICLSTPQAPLKLGPLPGKPSHPASLHHYIIQSFVTQDPRPHPRVAHCGTRGPQSQEH